MSDDKRTRNDDEKIEREPGAPLLPGEKYCGEKYRFSIKHRSVSWHGPKGDIKIPISSGFDRILDSLERLGKSHGSFKLTPGGVVLTKIKLRDDYEPVFVCNIHGHFEFNADIDMNPDDCKPGSLWPGIYDGCRSAFLGDRVWWTKPVDWDENSFVAISGRWSWKKVIPKEILNQLILLKPDGGSFRVTSTGHVITLVLANDNRFSKHADEFDELSDQQQALILMYMREYLPKSSTLRDVMMNMLPVYVGKLPDDFLPLRFEPPKSYVEELDAGSRAAILEFLRKPSNAKKSTSTDRLEETMHNSPDMDDEDEGVNE